MPLREGLLLLLLVSFTVVRGRMEFAEVHYRFSGTWHRQMRLLGQRMSTKRMARKNAISEGNPKPLTAGAATM